MCLSAASGSAPLLALRAEAVTAGPLDLEPSRSPSRRRPPAHEGRMAPPRSRRSRRRLNFTGARPAGNKYPSQFRSFSNQRYCRINGSHLEDDKEGHGHCTNGVSACRGRASTVERKQLSASPTSCPRTRTSTKLNEHVARCRGVPPPRGWRQLGSHHFTAASPPRRRALTSQLHAVSADVATSNVSRAFMNGTPELVAWACLH
jgi:hypothetical protein